MLAKSIRLINTLNVFIFILLVKDTVSCDILHYFLLILASYTTTGVIFLDGLKYLFFGQSIRHNDYF